MTVFVIKVIVVNVIKVLTEIPNSFDIDDVFCVKEREKHDDLWECSKAKNVLRQQVDFACCLQAFSIPYSDHSLNYGVLNSWDLYSIPITLELEGWELSISSILYSLQSFGWGGWNSFLEFLVASFLSTFR